ncbi:MAG: hypothetical protein ABJA20_08715 [Novosphingobium sp.]
MKQVQTVFDVANETPIGAELLADIYAMQAAMPLEARKSPDARRARLVDLLEEKGEHDHDRLRALVASIELRQVALDRLVQDGDARGFTQPVAEVGKARVHQDIFRCAGEEALVRIDGEVRFEPASFQRRLLSFTEARGNA